MMNNTSNNNTKKMIPVYLTIHYGMKGDKKIYAHSKQAIEKAGGKWMSSWKSLGKPICYKQAS